ncbi:MAG: HNH endonuclease [Bacillota bacterium]|nr:HNH endonuclease [Bacillota bacterium]
MLAHVAQCPLAYDQNHLLVKNSLCVPCHAEGKPTPATVIHYIFSHSGGWKLFWDSGNCQALCKECHDKKAERRIKDSSTLKTIVIFIFT